MVAAAANGMLSFMATPALEAIAAKLSAAYLESAIQSIHDVSRTLAEYGAANLAPLNYDLSLDCFNEFAEAVTNRLADVSSGAVELQSARLVELSDAQAKPGTTITVRNNQLYVTFLTPEIVLEEVNFGKFKIRFITGTGHRTTGIEVEAVTPNRPTPNDPVVHPHVNGNNICLGNGGNAVYKALADGRYCDAYDIILSILNTYNAGSPYRRIEVWKGTPCRECGVTLGTNDMHRYIGGGGADRVCKNCGIQLFKPVPNDVLSIAGHPVEIRNWARKSQVAKCPSCSRPSVHGTIQSCQICSKAGCDSCETFSAVSTLGLSRVCSACRAELVAAMAPASEPAPAAAAAQSPNDMVKCDCGGSVRRAMIVTCKKTGKKVCPICDPDDTGEHASVRE